MSDGVNKLYIGKETYGNIPMEEAFKKALEPYFSDNDEFEHEKENIEKSNIKYKGS